MRSDTNSLLTDKTWFKMDSTQEVTIRNLEIQEENTLAKLQAQNVLHLVYRGFQLYI
jgi:hypothetical protein